MEMKKLMKHIVMKKTNERKNTSRYCFRKRKDNPCGILETYPSPSAYCV